MGPGSALAVLACPGRRGERVCVRVLAAWFRPRFANSFVLTLKPEGAGKAGCRLTPAVSCAKTHSIGAHEHTGSAETARLSPRNGFTAYFVLSPVSGLFCHRHCAGYSPRNLAPASRRQDHTTSPYALAFRPALKTPDAKASTASRALRVVTIMIRPSCGRETGEASAIDLPDVESGIRPSG